MISIYKKFAFGVGICLTMGLTGCSDSYMEEMNTDQSKPVNISAGPQLTYALLSTYGDFHAMETFRAYIAPYTQQYGGSWNSGHHGGANTYADNNTAALWNAYYSKGIKNLVDAEHHCGDDAALEAAIRIQKVYMFNVLTDIYGDIPAREAGLAYYEGITNPKYDTQEDVYNFLFEELDKSIEALKGITSASSVKKADVTSMEGDTQMWLRYANSLKMRLAMRISDAAPAKAQQMFKEAYESGAFSTDENAYVKYLHIAYGFGSAADDQDYRINAFSEILYGQDKTSPTGFGMTLYNFMKEEKDPRLYHLCRFINDNFRDNTDPNIGREDFTEEVLAAEEKGDVAGVQMVPTCWAWYNSGLTKAGNYAWPTVDCIKNTDHYKKFVEGREDDVDDNYCVRAVRGMIATEFVLPETPGMLISGAEVALLKAEAALKGWIDADANALYKEGIRAAMEVVMNKVYSPKNTIDSNEIETYIAAHNLSADAEKAKEQINTQAWYLHFFNPVECWANLRRSDYPRLYERTQFGEGEGGYADPEGNMQQPVRLYYPAFEINYNRDNYNEAINRMPGQKFSWHSRMWWDTKDMEYQSYHNGKE